MNYYGNDEERVRLIAGLRDHTDFLDRNPEVPTPWGTDILVFPIEASDAEMIGSTASDAHSPRGHYGAVRNFGPVRYRAVAIPRSARRNGGGE